MASMPGPLSNFAGAVPGAFRGIVEITPHSRLRHQIRDTLDLYARASACSGLENATSDLAQVIEIQSKLLLVSVSRTGGRRWDWSQFWVGMAFTAVVGFGAWQGWNNRGAWWGWLLLVVLGLFDILVFGVAVQSLLQRKPAADASANTPRAGG